LQEPLSNYPLSEEQQKQFKRNQLFEFYKFPDKKQWENGERYIMPYSTNTLITMSNKKHSPYKVLYKFPEIVTKLTFLSQYGITHHSIE
jgi:hypothetical protein